MQSERASVVSALSTGRRPVTGLPVRAPFVLTIAQLPCTLQRAALLLLVLAAGAQVRPCRCRGGDEHALKLKSLTVRHLGSKTLMGQGPINGPTSMTAS